MTKETPKIYRVLYDGEEDQEFSTLNAALSYIQKEMSNLELELQADLWTIQEITDIPIEVIINVTVSQKKG